MGDFDGVRTMRFIEIELNGPMVPPYNMDGKCKASAQPWCGGTIEPNDGGVVNNGNGNGTRIKIDESVNRCECCFVQDTNEQKYPLYNIRRMLSITLHYS